MSITRQLWNDLLVEIQESQVEPPPPGLPTLPIFHQLFNIIRALRKVERTAVFVDIRMSRLQAGEVKGIPKESLHEALAFASLATMRKDAGFFFVHEYGVWRSSCYSLHPFLSQLEQDEYLIVEFLDTITVPETNYLLRYEGQSRSGTPGFFANPYNFQNFQESIDLCKSEGVKMIYISADIPNEVVFDPDMTVVDLKLTSMTDFALDFFSSDDDE